MLKQILGYFSKYAYKTDSRENKKVLYEGLVKDIPAEYKELESKIMLGQKYCVIYKETEDSK